MPDPQNPPNGGLPDLGDIARQAAAIVQQRNGGNPPAPQPAIEEQAPRASVRAMLGGHRPEKQAFANSNKVHDNHQPGKDNREGLTVDQAKDLRPFAIMAKDVYGADKAPEKLQEIGVQRITDRATLEKLVDPKKFKIADDGTITNSKNGFKAALYQDQQGRTTVSIAGSENPLKFNQRALTTWGNNLACGAGKRCSHDKQAQQLVQACQKEFGADKVDIVGHSAGGRAAAYASLKTGAPAVTFNADGFGPGYRFASPAGNAMKGPGAELITQVRTSGDQLGALTPTHKLPSSKIFIAGEGGHGMGAMMGAIDRAAGLAEQTIKAPKVEGPPKMNALEAEALKPSAIMAKDVYNAQKNPEALQEIGVSRVTDKETLQELVGKNKHMKIADDGTLTDKRTGFKAAVYQDNNGKMTVSIAGSETKANLRALTTWGNNLVCGMGAKCPHDKQAQRLVEACQNKFGKDSVSVVGHSAGGRAAAYASLKTGAPATTFNADGLGPGYRAFSPAGKGLTGEGAGNITQVRTKQDELGKMLKVLPNKLPDGPILDAGNGKHGMGDVIKALDNRVAWGKAVSQEAKQSQPSVGASIGSRRG